MVSLRTYLQPNTQQFASNVKIIFSEVIGVSQGFHNLVLIYNLVNLNSLISSRLVDYSLNAQKRSTINVATIYSNIKILENIFTRSSVFVPTFGT